MPFWVSVSVPRLRMPPPSIVAVFAVMAMSKTRALEWSVPHLEPKLAIVSGFGLLCASPWVSLTWLSHQAQRRYWRERKSE